VVAWYAALVFLMFAALSAGYVVEWQQLGVHSIARQVFGWAVYLYLIPLPALAINTIGRD
jgi:hypothetical protein